MLKRVVVLILYKYISRSELYVRWAHAV